jgi:hypothetical protein
MSQPKPDSASPHANRTSPFRIPAIIALVVIAGLSIWFVTHSIKRIRLGYRGDFKHFFYAAAALRAGKDPYESGGGGYIYPPETAWAFVPLTYFGNNDDFQGHFEREGDKGFWGKTIPPAAAWSALALAMGTTLGALWVASAEGARRLGHTDDPNRIVVAAAGAFVLMNSNIRGDVQMLQTNGPMALAFALSLRWIDRRPWLAGLALGVACNIKYLTIAMIPYLLVRRRWKVTLSFILCAVGIALLPALWIGWEKNLRMVELGFAGLLSLIGVNVPGSAQIEALDVPLSISFPSAFARMTHSTKAAWLLAGCVGIGFVVAAILAYRRRKVRLFTWPNATTQATQPWAGRVAVEWAMMMALTLALSPQTNTRHLAIMAVPVAISLGGILGVNRRLPRVWLGAGVLIVILALQMPPVIGLKTFLARLSDQWHAIGGPSWGLLIMAGIFAKVGMDLALARPDEELPLSPQPRSAPALAGI